MTCFVATLTTVLHCIWIGSLVLGFSLIAFVLFIDKLNFQLKFDG